MEKKVSRVKQFLSRWRNEYDFRTFVAASCSLATSVVFAFYNGYLGLRHASLWYGTICVYYIVLVLLRGTVIAAAKIISVREQQECARNRVYLIVSAMLFLLNICLILPVSLMVRQQKPVDLTLVPAIAMAAYTTYRVVIASVNLKRRRRSSDSLVRLLRTIGFIDALVSILTLQNTLIMVTSNGGALELLPMTAVTSGAVWAAVLLLSIAAIIKGSRQIKGKD